MGNHWQEAQEQVQREGWGNFVFTLDSQACIAGSLKCGWIIISSQYNLKLGAQTVQGVELVLEELGLSSLGWH